ncbi:MAG TPA: amidohydrolase family protein [Sphingomicrobium sp.]|nr:amidohydrolase family protein [Sphingomicrobium sp.]
MSRALRLGQIAVTVSVVTGFALAQPVHREIAPPPSLDDPYPSRYKPMASPPVVLSGATILDGVGGRIDVGEILLANGKIVALGRKVQRPSGALVIDARGKWVTPGLIDVHTHLGVYTLPQTSLDARASDVVEQRDPDASDTWIEHAVRSVDPGFSHALRAGVTTLQILPGSSDLFGGRSVIVHPIASPTIAGMKFPGAPQGLKMACGDNPKQAFAARNLLNSRQGEMAQMRETFLKAKQYREQHPLADRENHKGEANVDLREETLAAVLDGKIPVHIHCYRSDDMARLIDLAHEFGFRIAAFHHAAEAYKIAPLIVSSGICIAAWPDWWGFKPEAEDAIRENIAIIDAAGGCAMVHSDIPILGEHLNLEAAKAAGSGRRMGYSLPPERVIRWVTSNPAKALALDGRIGRLAPGFNADVVLWSGNPFSIYSKPEKIFIDGALEFDSTAPKRLSDFELGRAITSEHP